MPPTIHPRSEARGHRPPPQPPAIHRPPMSTTPPQTTAAAAPAAGVASPWPGRSPRAASRRIPPPHRRDRTRRGAVARPRPTLCPTAAREARRALSTARPRSPPRPTAPPPPSTPLPSMQGPPPRRRRRPRPRVTVALAPRRHPHWRRRPRWPARRHPSRPVVVVSTWARPPLWCQGRRCGRGGLGSRRVPRARSRQPAAEATSSATRRRCRPRPGGSAALPPPLAPPLAPQQQPRARALRTAATRAASARPGSVQPCRAPLGAPGHS